MFRFAGKPTGIADASDVAKLLLALPFVLGCLGQLELEAYNSRRTRTRYLLSDPFRPIIGALNEYLHDSARVSHVPSRDPVRNRDRHVDTKSLQALDTLQRVFPYSITLAGGRQRSAGEWCAETRKAHSMTHWGDNYHTVGRIRTVTTQVTETRMKSVVKTKACKTNNQA